MEVSLLPADCYTVVNKSILTDEDKKNLISFYEPIIGHLATSLYLTLFNDLESSMQISRELTHHHLMSILKTPLKNIKVARESLEAVGLIRSFFKAGDVNSYIYELYTPLTPNEFFSHPILNIVLYNNIGATEYEYLKKKYKKFRIDTKDYTDITKKMDEVYESKLNIAFEADDRETLDISVGNIIDFDLLVSSIPKGIINERAFNKKTKELIDKNALRLAARKMYQNTKGGLPTLIYRAQPEYLKTPSGDTSMRGKIIQMFESINPVDFLMTKYNGVKPTNRDIKMIENLIVDLEMPPAVVNVLLDYVLRKNNNKLSTNYVEAIAGQWKRSGLKTAKEAMDFAEKENKKLTKKMAFAKTETKEPVWFNKLNEKEQMTDEEKEELENLLKEFK